MKLVSCVNCLSWLPTYSCRWANSASRLVLVFIYWLKLSYYMSQVGGSWLESASKVTSGSVISSSVGSVGCYGTRAIISFSFPPCCSLLCPDEILMVLSISSSLETSCLRFACFLVWTIFQLSVYYKLKFFDQTVF